MCISVDMVNVLCSGANRRYYQGGPVVVGAVKKTVQVSLADIVDVKTVGGDTAFLLAAKAGNARAAMALVEYGANTAAASPPHII